jgi:hypothetical protein
VIYLQIFIPDTLYELMEVLVGQSLECWPRALSLGLALDQVQEGLVYKRPPSKNTFARGNLPHGEGLDRHHLIGDQVLSRR